MKVHIAYSNPQLHFITFQLTIEVRGEASLELQLPTWRPGRYEMGNFAKNIRNFQVQTTSGEELSWHKTNSHLWNVNTNKQKQVVVQYEVYANILNAGSTYLDESQLYLNPVNCIPYLVSRPNEAYELTLGIPDEYQVAWPLKFQGTHWIAKDKEELYEAICIASEKLQHRSFVVEGYTFHVWFNGAVKPVWRKLLTHFYLFTKEQVKAFGSLPVQEYHYMFQILPFKTYHGVEHTACTICSLGPGSSIMQKEGYEKLLGISSHELYHTWNIKQIRPAEMHPYDYTKENYTNLGFLAEGVTTYMGDMMLAQSGAFNYNQFIKTQEENLQKHFDNFGRFNNSLAHSGFDTWLDGYEMGIPDRKVSIYAEGALCMFMMDLAIRTKSRNKNSLQTAMTRLYKEWACADKGVSEEDLKDLLVSLGGDEAEDIWNNYIYKKGDYRKVLDKRFKQIGLNIVSSDNPRNDMRLLGVKALRNTGKEGKLVRQVVPGSVAEQAGIAPGDEILSVNGVEIKTSLSKSLEGITKGKVELRVKKLLRKVNVTVELKGESYFPVYKLEPSAKATEKQKEMFTEWCGLDWPL